MKNIIILDSKQFVRQRIKDVMSDTDVNVIEVSNSAELFSQLKVSVEAPSLIVMDLSLIDEDGISVMRKLKKSGSTVPIMILTAINKRDSFVKGITEGAVDYILKPFQDDDLKKRIIKQIVTEKHEMDEHDEEITVNFEQYLEVELKRSQKGNYSISVVMSTFFKNIENHDENEEDDYILFGHKIYEVLKKIFWDTDAYFRYDMQSFVGVFPFSDENKTRIIIEKINKMFDEIKGSIPEINSYELASVFVISPEESINKEEIMEKLTEKMNIELDAKKEKNDSETGVEDEKKEDILDEKQEGIDEIAAKDDAVQ